MIRLCAFADEAASDLSGQIRALKRNGISLIELRHVNGKRVDALTVEEASEIAAALAAAGISVWALGSPMGKVALDCDFEKYLGEVEHMCRVARAVGTDKIRMFSFYGAEGKEALVLSRLAEMVKVAAAHGVTLYHENEKDIFGDTVARVETLMAGVAGLKFVYDPANFLQVGESAAHSLSRLQTRCDYFHVKDVIAATGELVPAGEGDGEIPLLLSRLSGDTVLTVEPHLRVFAGYAAIDNSEMKHKHSFESADAAFDAAVTALKKLLAEAGYRQNGKGYIK